MSEIEQLYEKDLNLWYEKTEIAIAKRDVKNIDWDNLLDEFQDMSKSEKRALRSYTKRLIEHILKLKYWQSQQEYNQKHWRKEVVNFRAEINQILLDSPSLKNYLQDNYQSWYNSSVKAMRQQFTIPQDNLVALQIIMQDDYFGENNPQS